MVMSKSKFEERRRIARRNDKASYLDVRAKIDDLVSFALELGLEALVHRGGDDDDYCGFEIWPDTRESFAWIEILNPGLGNGLELALYGGVQIVTNTAFRNYPPYPKSYEKLLEDLAGYVRGANVMVRVEVGDRLVTQGLVAVSSLGTTDWSGFIEQLIATDFNWSACNWCDNSSYRKSQLKELSKEVYLKGCRVLVERWSAKENQEILIASGVRFGGSIKF